MMYTELLNVRMSLFYMSTIRVALTPDREWLILSTTWRNMDPLKRQTPADWAVYLVAE